MAFCLRILSPDALSIAVGEVRVSSEKDEEEAPGTVRLNDRRDAVRAQSWRQMHAEARMGHEHDQPPASDVTHPATPAQLQAPGTRLSLERTQLSHQLCSSNKPFIACRCSKVELHLPGTCPCERG